METKATKYLFFHKDAKDAENKYIEHHGDKNHPGSLLRIRREFQNFFMYQYKHEIIDMHMKFDEADNPFTLIAYIDEFGIIQYTKFDEEIHRIKNN